MDEHKKWFTQLNKGFFELCILALLDQHEKDGMYGSRIKEQLNEVALNINEGTLYPLLNRMHDNGYLSSAWQTPNNNKGHPIRLYHINKQGKGLFKILLSAYQQNYQTLQLLIKA